MPAAKFSDIAEYVWLLEKTNADVAFLVFGKDRDLPQRWLKRFGALAPGVRFFFLDDDGGLTELAP